MLGNYEVVCELVAFGARESARLKGYGAKRAAVQRLVADSMACIIMQPRLCIACANSVCLSEVGKGEIWLGQQGLIKITENR